MENDQFNRTMHGSLYDRGGADSYYRRSKRPHWWPKGLRAKEITDLTVEEKTEYLQGYQNNENDGFFEDYE